MVDVLAAEIPDPGARVHASVELRAGGSAANAAAWASRLGASAVVVGRVGMDAAGDLVAGALVDHGVEPQLARDPEQPTGVAVAVGPGADGGVVASPGASARLAVGDVPDPLRGDALLVSGFTLLHASSRAAARAALERFEGRWTAVDLASPQLAATVTRDELLADAEVVFATEAEGRAATAEPAEEAARALARRFEVACVKLGARGAIAARGDEVRHAAGEPVERRSRFGAGDAFAAAFLVSLARAEPLGRALEIACATGAAAAASTAGWPPRRYDAARTA
jgi:sugar/nucleoside kinase (ribokinase family)